MLELYYDSRAAQLGGLTVVSALIIMPLVLTLGQFDGISNWWLWLIGVSVVLLCCVGMGRDRYSAGADWFMRGKRVIDTYSLISIEYEPRDTEWNHHKPPYITLRDRHGDSIRTNFDDLQDKPDMWALVYNGIRHSVLDGAEFDPVAVDGLDLYDVIRSRERQRAAQPSADRPD